ncbi:probable pectinesterase 53 [Phoenix dactylifera]|uniref:Pectinesterase n=1 Tax=Phoenix dactylifera TaxID=42345 RepID=A0A8B8ZCS5_PHODC|nr:probable pectinesterase 53 [Phoenix dactylifera]
MNRAFSPFFLAVLVSVALHVHQVSGLDANITKIIKVNHHGAGDFKTIQEAINSVPVNNSQWIRIHVSAGVYKEKVCIQDHQEFVLLEGEGREKTVIEWGDYSGDSGNHNTLTSATFTSRADYFVAKHITFKVFRHKNSCYKSCEFLQFIYAFLSIYIRCNNTKTGERGYLFILQTMQNSAGPVGQAVAALLRGNHSAFYGCGFIGVQDTLYDQKGLHYFKDCYIEGSTDFIFGSGQSIYEGCTLFTVLRPGFLTAQGRQGPAEDNGFVFKHCNVTGTQKVFLGRAWGRQARVIFYETIMSDIVNPQGWIAWLGQE